MGIEREKFFFACCMSLAAAYPFQIITHSPVISNIYDIRVHFAGRKLVHYLRTSPCFPMQVLTENLLQRTYVLCTTRVRRGEEARRAYRRGRGRAGRWRRPAA